MIKTRGARVSRSRVDHRERERWESKRRDGRNWFAATFSAYSTLGARFALSPRRSLALATSLLLTRTTTRKQGPQHTERRRGATTVPVGPIVPALAARGRHRGGAQVDRDRRMARARLRKIECLVRAGSIGDRFLQRDVLRMVHGMIVASDCRRSCPRFPRISIEVRVELSDHECDMNMERDSFSFVAVNYFRANPENDLLIAKWRKYFWCYIIVQMRYATDNPSGVILSKKKVSWFILFIVWRVRHEYMRERSYENILIENSQARNVWKFLVIAMFLDLKR